MTPFLKQVARHYLNSGLSFRNSVFVFPSHRATMFFRKYLAEELAGSGHSPVFSPRCLSMEDFLSGLSTLRKLDSLSLLLILYKCYERIHKERGMECESIDDFIFWGDILLGDFNDIDKYLANPRDLLRNVSQLKEMQDDWSDLSQTQIEAIERFAGHFVTGGRYKEKFARIWNMLLPLYSGFKSALLEEGCAYDGMLYRQVLDNIREKGAESVLKTPFPSCTKVVFCGLNALSECEKAILEHLQKLSLAEFCWDYAGDWIADSANKSSFFMKDNVKAFPQAFALEKIATKPSFEVVSVPSSTGQVKLLASLLDAADVPKDERTAVILPDETLLLPFLNSIPQSVRSVNVTMGYPLSSSSFASLLEEMCSLLLHLRLKDGALSFYHRPVWAIAGNNLFRALSGDGATGILQALRKERRYYLRQDALKGDPMLDVVFNSPFITAGSVASGGGVPSVEAIEKYLASVLDFIGSTIASDDNLKSRFPLELDFAMECVKALNLLSGKLSDARPATYISLLRNLFGKASVPFKGEPLSGLQVMGPLEIRALDFDRLFILSANEGVFPRRSISPSFIPPLLRKGFGLPTYEYQDAVWAYYFYRMVQRPSKVCLIMDSRTEGLKSSEESCYIRQLEYHFKVQPDRRRADAAISVVRADDDIPKTEEDIAVVRGKALSATALNAYLDCPAKFYYMFIKELLSDDEVSESMDNAAIGNVYHSVMQKLYSRRPQGKVTAEYLEGLLAGGEKIAALVEECAKAAIDADVIAGRDIVLCRMISKYVTATLKRDLELVREKGPGHFEVIGLEKNLYADFHGFSLKGRIDRLDSPGDGTVRIVDYKTGGVSADDIGITDDKAQTVIDKIFHCEKGTRPGIALQFFIYDYLYLNGGDLERREGSLCNSVYAAREMLSSPPVSSPVNRQFYDGACAELEDLLEEMVNPGLPFKHTDDNGRCKYCNFKAICGR